MNKLKSLEIKKLLKELEFTESDFEYRNLAVSEADSLFIDSINTFLNHHPDLKKIYDDKITEKINKTIEKIQKNFDEEQEIENENEKNENEDFENDISLSEEILNNEERVNISQIKKLYREIAKLTHPDKINSNKYNDLYIKSTKFYESNNKIGIYSICQELEIEYEVEDDDASLINVEIETLRNKINFIESTFAWQWYNCEDEILKSQILLNFIKLKIR